MTDNQLFIVFAAIGLVFVYPIVHVLLFRRMHPLRMRLLDLGDDLLDSNLLSDREARIVYRAMVDMCNWKVAVFFALAVPVYLVRQVFTLKRSDVSLQNYSAETREKFSVFMRLFLTSIMAACPIAAVLIVLELMIILPVLFLMGRLQKLTTFQMTIFSLREQHFRGS